MSSPLRGRPSLVPSTIILAHSSAAASSKGRIWPWKRARGPSGPLNQFSNSRLFRPSGFARIPRLISASVNVAMKRSVRGCCSSHSSKVCEGSGLVASLMTFVSRRYRVKDRSRARTQWDARFPSLFQPTVIVAALRQCSCRAVLLRLSFGSILFAGAQPQRRLPQADVRPAGPVPCLD
jgi:hypothetical protein